MPGELYAFEGPDGVGKSTLAKLLSEHLNRESIPHELLSFPGNEPHTVSELIYRLYHAPQSFGIDSITPLSLQVMVTAAHIEVIESRIKPTLQSGKTVILDRFWW